MKEELLNKCTLANNKSYKHQYFSQTLMPQIARDHIITSSFKGSLKFLWEVIEVLCHFDWYKIIKFLIFHCIHFSHHLLSTKTKVLYLKTKCSYVKFLSRFRLRDYHTWSSVGPDKGSTHKCWLSPCVESRGVQVVGARWYLWLHGIYNIMPF